MDLIIVIETQEISTHGEVKITLEHTPPLINTRQTNNCLRHDIHTSQGFAVISNNFKSRKKLSTFLIFYI